MSKVKAIIKPVVEELGQITKTVGEQMVGTSSQPKADRPLDEKEETKEIVKHLYGNKDQEELKPEEVLKQKETDKKELEKKRAQLATHQRYFERLMNPPKRQEEKPAERVERQKMEELQQKTEKEKEKEKKRAGIIRAQQKVEKYPGASG